MNKKSTVHPLIFVYSFQEIFDEKYQPYFGESAYTTFTQGYCCHFARLLNRNYPNSQLYYNDSHVRCRIGDLLYDVCGAHNITDEYRACEADEDKYYLEVHFSRGSETDQKIDKLLDEISNETIQNIIDENKPKSRKR